MTINDLLNEEILGNTAIVYHNGDENFPEYLSTGKYESGKHAGNFYGEGIYSFLHIEDTRLNYGPILYKIRVKDLNNFFIFDYDEYKKINKSLKSSPGDFIEEQNKKFNIPKDMYIKNKDDFIKYENNEYIRNKVAGFIYSNGKNDKGGVLVAFRYYSLIPLAWSKDQGKTWLKINTTHDYRKNASNLNSNTSNKIIKKFEDTFKENEMGNINCSFRQLTNLEGAPREIKGNFDCSNNNLISLRGSPKIINGYFTCANNNSLTSLYGAPQIIKGDFSCCKNDLSIQEILKYLKTCKIDGKIYTHYGDFDSQKEAMEKLSKENISENCFNY